jgi:hypothetical protein
MDNKVRLKKEEYYQKVYEDRKSWYYSLDTKIDTLILVLSTGAIILSIDYAKEFFTTSNSYQNLFIISLIFLVLTIFFNLFSVVLSWVATHREKIKLDIWRESKNIETPFLSTTSGNIARVFNFVSIFTLISGMFLLLIFITLSLTMVK